MNFLFSLTASLLYLCLSLTPAFSETTESAYAAAQRGEFERSLEIATPLAEEGNSEAQVLLGMQHMMGLGTNPNPDVAIEWYQRAADQNNANALASSLIFLYKIVQKTQVVMCLCVIWLNL